MRIARRTLCVAATAALLSLGGCGDGLGPQELAYYELRSVAGFELPVTFPLEIPPESFAPLRTTILFETIAVAPDGSGSWYMQHRMETDTPAWDFVERYDIRVLQAGSLRVLRTSHCPDGLAECLTRYTERVESFGPDRIVLRSDLGQRVFVRVGGPPSRPSLLRQLAPQP